MQKYEPQFLGKVIPVDDPSKLTVFCAQQYDAFHRIYGVCKEQSEQISDLSTVDTKSIDPTSLAVKITAGREAVDAIIATAKGDPSISIRDNVITATGSNQDKK